MSLPDPVGTYARSVVSGKVPACRWQQLACQRHLSDRAAGDWEFNKRLAAWAIEFFTHLRHFKGEWAGQPAVLEPWQAFLTGSVFGWVSPETGARRYRVAYVEVPRSNGKSTLVAGWALLLTAFDDEPAAEVYCLDPATRILHSDLTWRPIGEAMVGDELIGFDEEPITPRAFRKARRARVSAVWVRQSEAVRVEFATGDHVICSRSHRWLSRSPCASNLRWRATSDLAPGYSVRFFGRPWAEDESRQAGYLAGLFDGEASFHAPLAEGSAYRVAFAQNRGVVFTEAQRLLRQCGFYITEEFRNGAHSECYKVEIRGLYQVLRLLGQIKPLRLYARHPEIWEGRALRIGAKDWRDDDLSQLEIAQIVPLGKRDLIDIETSTGTFLAEGLFSHNCAATKRDQAKIVLDTARGLALGNYDELKAHLTVGRHSVYQSRSASRLEAVSADAQKLDGLRPHGVIIDEVHAHQTSEVVDVMHSALGGRRQPLIAEITTAGIARESICFEHHSYSEAVLNGSLEDPSWFAFLSGIDEGDDWRDPTVWAKANPNYGVSVTFDDLDRQARQALGMPARQYVFRQKRLNEWLQATAQFIDRLVWDRQAGPAIADEWFVGRECFGGLDLSSVSDLTAWALVFPGEDGEFVCRWRLWVPAPTLQGKMGAAYRAWAEAGYLTVIDGPVIDYAQVKAEILLDASRYAIVDVNIDRLFQAQQLSNELADEGLRVFGFGMGYLSMAPVMREFERLILAEQLRHGGHPVIRWMVENLVVRRDPAGNMKPDKDKSAAKIDGLVALLLALDRALRHHRASAYDDDHRLLVV